MGAWGQGTFDNDAAGDWLLDLSTSSGLAVLREAFRLPDDYIEVDDGSVALAAAEVVLALAGNERSGLPAEVREWAGSNAGLDPRPLKSAAASAIIQVLGNNSELDDLWSDSEHYEDWRADIEMLLGAIDQI